MYGWVDMQGVINFNVFVQLNNQNIYLLSFFKQLSKTMLKQQICVISKPAGIS